MLPVALLANVEVELLAVVLELPLTPGAAVIVATAPSRDVVRLVEKTDGFTGAEIEASIVSAMYEAFYYSREINNSDLEKAIKETVPLSKTMAESINALRKWANNRARNASQKF